MLGWLLQGGFWISDARYLFVHQYLFSTSESRVYSYTQVLTFPIRKVLVDGIVPGDVSLRVSATAYFRLRIQSFSLMIQKHPRRICVPPRCLTMQPALRNDKANSLHQL